LKEKLLAPEPLLDAGSSDFGILDEAPVYVSPNLPETRPILSTDGAG